MTQDNNAGLPLLLEIGTEEIPARFIPPALSDLKRTAAEVFAEYRISCGDIRTYATPRRMSLLVEAVSPMQNDVVKEIFGPSKKAAFDDKGNPTRAAEGFAASLGIQVSDLATKNKGKGEYVVALIEEKGSETRAVMPEALRKIVLSLRFPKSMRWGNGSMTFARPIHWFTAILGTEPVSFEIDGVKGGNITRGHRFLSPASFQVKEVASYMSLLENNFVILDQNKREKMIRDGITGLAAASGGQPLMDDELIGMVNYLVEYPVPVLCGFHGDYLALPKELLVTVMKDHQKYFAILDDGGSLINKFVVISNTRSDNAETVRVGAERVIRARFDDARFYFTEDRKKPLAGRVEDLGKVTFQDKLGSLFMKTERIIAVASFLAERVNPGLKERVTRAALLSKTDLITGAVREFPELQGIMGRYYAVLDNEDREVADALEEQYLPKSYGGRMPVSETGALLSLADKIDNIASFFSIGLVPSGSEDPFALRRQAMGIVSIIMDRGYGMSLREIFEGALLNLPLKDDREKVLATIISFMGQRIEYILSTMGYEQELVSSVLHFVSVASVKEITERLDALRQFRQEAVFPDFLLAIKRVNNIIPKAPLPALREDLLQLAEEKNLSASLAQASGPVSSLVRERRFGEATMAVAGLAGPINSFFDKVLVMDKQEELRNNRLALLRDVWIVAAKLADFSKLS